MPTPPHVHHERFSCDDEDFRARTATEKRPDLQLTVLAPEEPGTDPRPRVLFTAPRCVTTPGRVEEYLSKT